MLPYAGDELSMTIVVPDAGTYVSVEAALDASFIDAVDSSLENRLIRLALSSWRFRSQLALKEPLQKLGMRHAFSDAADFSAMSPEALAITDVLQEVYIAVDENGTEAAAATAVIVGETSAPSAEPVELIVDRPFLFWISDRETGATLFLGRVLDPRAGPGA